MRDKKSTLLYRWFEEVWNQNREESIDTLMKEDCNAYGILSPERPKGTNGFKTFQRAFREQFENIQIDVQDVIAQDDMESALMQVTATHRETGKKVAFSGICMAKMEEGKIAEAWNQYDFLSLYQQLGHVLTPGQGL